MKFKLISTTSNEVIDVVDVIDSKRAKEFFINRKQLKENQFDSLFKVEPELTTRRYEWWKEERTNLDDF
jgi:hypothetical protein